MKIGIVGAGFVGLTFAAVLASKNYQVLVLDIDNKKLYKINKGISPFFEPKLQAILKKTTKLSLQVTNDFKKLVDDSNLIFITVGTPLTKNGRIDLKSVNSTTKKIGGILKNSKNIPLIIIKSTVVPGTNNNLKKILEEKSGKKCGKGFELLSNPEFLREGSAIDDTLNPHITIIGGNDNKSIKKLEQFYKKFFTKKIPLIKTNPQTAELIKYTNNSFLATKISFINQIANLCQVVPGTNIDEIANAIGLDPRIGKQFLKAGPGYGGSCLPKDLQALISFSEMKGKKSSFLKAVQKANAEQLKNVQSLLKTIFSNLKGRKITILGLSFKENSDDIRDSVSIKLIRSLLKLGAKITVHDVMALENTKIIFRRKITYAKKISEALKNCECAIIMTAWNDYSKLTSKDFRKMKKRVIIDSRRLLAKKKLDASYYALGIGSK